MTNEISYEVGSFQTAMGHLADQLLRSTPVHIGEWQSTDVSKSQLHATYELADVSLYMNIPGSPEGLRKWTHPFVNKVWAEEHFLERVGGNPVNPPPSHERWPWARHNGNHQKDDQFSHTYPERMWPKHAGECHDSYAWGFDGQPEPMDMHGQLEDGRKGCNGRKGIRFMYGDLSNVVDLLVRNPLTRQAYLPIWFPEDTGAVHRERVPCTLGYHFMFRDNVLSCRYYMRSCDLIRHFADDVYLASRLTQWVHEEWQQRVTFKAMTLNPEVRNWAAPATQVGRLIMHVSSLHAFVGDAYKLKELAG
jgi:hypothetical protein